MSASFNFCSAKPPPAPVPLPKVSWDHQLADAERDLLYATLDELDIAAISTLHSFFRSSVSRDEVRLRRSVDAARTSTNYLLVSPTWGKMASPNPSDTLLGSGMNDFETHWLPATTDDAIELVVDLSNVCFDLDLGDARRRAQLSRLDLVAEAWDVWAPDYGDPAVRLVADDVLRSSCSSDERRRLKSLESRGWLEWAEKADPVILDHAQRSTAMVLSNDQYVGHRREFPWIEANATQFIGWDSRHGLAVLRPSRIRAATGYSVSRAAEADEIKELRLHSDDGRKTLGGVYRCENDHCIRRRLAPAGAEAAPNRRGPEKVPTCTGCGLPLALVGRRTDTAIVKLEGDAGVERVPVPGRSSVEVGRGSPDLKLRSVLTGPSLAKVSRRHLEVSLSDGAVRVKDLGSSGGSTLERWDAPQRAHHPPERLTPHRAVALRPRDRVVLAGVLTIERSGRRYPFDLAPVGAHAD